MLKKVAVTGAIASGKTTVCHYFKELGAYIVSADDIVHQLLSPHTSTGRQVIALLGSDIVVNGEIDRRIVANKVFHNRILLHSLENLIHPCVLNEIERQYQQICEQGKASLFAAEVPLLFEIGGEKGFDAAIMVDAAADECMKRFSEKHQSDEGEYARRMSFQMPQAAKMKLADYIIENKGSKEDLRLAVGHLFNKLISSD